MSTPLAILASGEAQVVIEARAVLEKLVGKRVKEGLVPKEEQAEWRRLVGQLGNQ